MTTNPVKPSGGAAPGAAPRAPRLARSAGTAHQIRPRPRGRTAAESLDLTLMPGEIVALVGESGSGKSTLAKSIIGLLPESANIPAGSIRLRRHRADRPVANAPWRRSAAARSAWCRRIPGGSLDPVKTIESQVAEVFRLHPEEGSAPRAKSRRKFSGSSNWWASTAPRERLKQYPHELSGGSSSAS